VFKNPTRAETRRLKNSTRAERIVVLAIRRQKMRSFQIYIYIYCASIDVSYIKNPGFAVENPNELRDMHYSQFKAKKLWPFEYYPVVNNGYVICQNCRFSEEFNTPSFFRRL